LAEFQRHNVGKEQIINFLLHIFAQCAHPQETLILWGGTESLKAIVKINKKLEEVIHSLQTRVIDVDGTVRNIALYSSSWELFAETLTGAKGEDAT